MSRKGKKRNSKDKEEQSARELKWEVFDTQLQGRVRVEETARVKWNAADAQERTVIALLRTKLKVNTMLDRIPIVPDASLTDTDIYCIGETMIDEFDPSELDIVNKLDPACMLYDHADRAPGVTDEQLELWETLIRHHLPPSLKAVTHKNVCRLLKQPLPPQEASPGGVQVRIHQQQESGRKNKSEDAHMQRDSCILLHLACSGVL